MVVICVESAFVSFPCVRARALKVVGLGHLYCLLALGELMKTMDVPLRGEVMVMVMLSRIDEMSKVVGRGGKSRQKRESRCVRTRSLALDMEDLPIKGPESYWAVAYAWHGPAGTCFESAGSTTRTDDDPRQLSM
jgi:hypothetical protein